MMTEAKWLRLTHFDVDMMDYLTGAVSDRKRRLFAVACCYRIWPLLDPELLRPAVAAAEELAEDASLGDGIGELRRAVEAVCGNHYDHHLSAPNAVRYAVATPDCVNGLTTAAHAATAVAFSATGDAGYRRRGGKQLKEREEREQLRLLRDVLGNPFRPVAFDQAWRSEAAVGLAAGIYADKAFERLPILADALGEAGCEEEGILSHCREPGVHVRGCWVVDLVLGRW